MMVLTRKFTAAHVMPNFSDLEALVMAMLPLLCPRIPNLLSHTLNNFPSLDRRQLKGKAALAVDSQSMLLNKCTLRTAHGTEDASHVPTATSLLILPT